MSAYVTANVGDEKNRYIISYQKRYGIDASLPFKVPLSRTVFKKNGRFWFLCICKCPNEPTNDSSPLEGKIFIFHSKKEWRENAEPLVKESITNLLNFRGLSDQSINDYFLDTFNALIDKTTKHSSYYVDFNLFRNGECEIGAPVDLTNISPKAPSFPKEEIERSHQEHIVCSQLFFF